MSDERKKQNWRVAPSRSAAPPSVNYVQEVRPDDPPPSCHRCGAVMVPTRFNCRSCGATTEPTEEAPPSEREAAELAAEEIYNRFIESKAFTPSRIMEVIERHLQARFGVKLTWPQLQKVVAAAAEAYGYLQADTSQVAKKLGLALEDAVNVLLTDDPLKSQARAAVPQAAPELEAHRFGTNNLCNKCGHSRGWLEEKQIDICDKGDLDVRQANRQRKEQAARAAAVPAPGTEEK